MRLSCSSSHRRHFDPHGYRFSSRSAHDSPHVDRIGGRIRDLRPAVFGDRRYEDEKVPAESGAPGSSTLADADTIQATRAAVVSSAPGEGERSAATEATLRICETAGSRRSTQLPEFSLTRDRSTWGRGGQLMPVPRRLILDVEPRRVDSAISLFLGNEVGV